tara:strand:- start:45 stop:308 length:264 start_codon:yes stop_codon:yes gene_type:complete
MLELIIAFYASGIVIAMWKLWFPSLETIKTIAPYSIVARKQVLSSLIVLIMFTIFLPLLVVCILFDNKAQQFINSFVKGATTEDERQ